MSERLLYMSPPNPDKFLKTPGSPYDFPLESANKTLYFMWMIPTTFIVVDPELSFYWINLNENPVKVDWLLKYQYLNKESHTGYFDEDGMPVISFDDGRSELYITTLKSDSVAEKSIIQKAPPHNLTKKGRRSGSLTTIEIHPQPPLDEVFYIGAEIRYKEYPRVVEPRGRKRTHKRSRWDYDDPHY